MDNQNSSVNDILSREREALSLPQVNEEPPLVITVPVTANTSDPDIAKHRLDLIMKLKRYKQSNLGKRFLSGIQALSSLDSIPATQNGIKQLEDLLAEVKMTIGCRNGPIFSKQLLTIGASLAENLAVRYTPIKAQGFTHTLISSEGIDDLCEEIALEYQTQTYIPPLYKLGYLSASLLMAVHTMNSNPQSPTPTPMSSANASDIIDANPDL